MVQDIAIVVIAAVLGYGTNWLAVKMLFWPRHPREVFGRRVPFTPGVIPARRDEIIEGISSGVAEHLLTPDVIQRELEDVDLLGPIEGYVRRLVERLAEEPAVAEGARQQVMEVAERMATSEDLHASLAERIRPGLRAGLGGAAAGGTLLITSLPWARALPRKTIASVAGGVGAVVAERVADEVARRLASSAAGMVRRAAEEGAVDDAAREALRRLPDALFAREGALRQRIEHGLREAIPEAARAIDVRRALERRLEGFAIEDLERLVLRACSTHLKAITWLGGAIGAVVGLMQVGLRHLAG